ncbi:MAG: amidohydrolase family protein [Acidimicrobiales bacterium]
MARRAMQWADVDGRRRLLVGGRINRFIPNPQFDPVARPGCLDDYFRGRSPADDIRGAFGELEPIRSEYRDPAARLAVLDRQGIDGCFLFPTLGVGMEEALVGDPDAAHAAFSAFNRWLDDDWGLHHAERLFAAPYLCLLDPDRAVDELEGARPWRPGDRHAGRPIMHPTGGRSPGDRVYDPFWQRANDAGITVAYHSGESGYGRYVSDWGESSEFEAFRRTPLYGVLTSDRAISDTMAALICHGVFRRFPDLRIATIESGSAWAAGLLAKLAKSFALTPGAFDGVDPVETFRRHIWVAPYYEDDIRDLADTIGADHVLFGSDWPHAEGLAEPRTFVDDLHGFSDEEVHLIMRDNGLALSRPRSDAGRSAR